MRGPLIYIKDLIAELDDTYFMRKAYEQAQIAFELGEVPVGAVIVSKQQIIARSHNLTERLNDVTAHAEMQAITSAANFLGGKYLKNCTLYVSLEPCQMCAGALYWSQISKVVFAAEDHKRGYRAFGASLHPKTQVVYGILQEECSSLLKEFFKEKRK
ncbi:nucleoside deaminase [Psychroflexus planctonicus]|uniref:tRNA-specific adenosine deaminase n=1 Tax=Psychroflexus planctonicus TaxID=1526575 RepID=A0ABQ1SJU9_9FLAO|nr:tRNA-specific adenosine deaminase [Psychroflexus planctonicus]